MKKRKSFVDVVGTLLHSDPDGWVLRPGVVELFAALKEMGRLVCLWRWRRPSW